MEEPQRAADSLGPRDVTTVVGDSFRIYFAGFARYFGTAAIIEGATAIFFAIAGIWLFGSMWDIFDAETFETENTIIAPEDLPRFIASVAAFAFIGGTAALISTAVGFATIMHLTAQQLTKTYRPLGQVFRYAFSKVIPLIKVVVVEVILAFFAMVAFGLVMAIPVLNVVLAIASPFVAIYAMVRLSQTFTLVIVEGKPALDALSGSWALHRDMWWHAFGALALSFIITIAVTISIGTLVGWIPLVGGIILNALLLPFWVIVLMLVYFNLRLREGEYAANALAREFGLAEPGWDWPPSTL